MESNDRCANELIAQMTLDEKLAQIGSCWMYDLESDDALDWDKVSRTLRHGLGQISRVAGASKLDPVRAARAGNSLQKFLMENTRLRIPAILHEECCAGAMELGGTIFPQMLGIASTFQPELAESMTTIIRKQLLAIGARQGLAPVLDVGRDPRWGWVEETFGEDPTLVSHFGAAYIRGLQSEDLATGVLATGKHFVGHSLSQGGLNCAPVHVGMRELYDVFLAPFQAAIRDAKLASIMNAYPELDGEVVAASRRILTDILRGQLGFEGVVVSDYEAVAMLHTFHKVAADCSEAAVMALQAGIDVELPATVCYGEPLKRALEAREITLELVDTAVRRHLQAKLALGLFENPYVDEGKVLEVFETPEQRELARELARKSMVLLQNDGLLPLPKAIRTIAVIGPNADHKRNLLADYSYPAMRQLMQWKGQDGFTPADKGMETGALTADDVKVVTVLEAIRGAGGAKTRVLYARGCDYFDLDRGGFEEAVRCAEQADAVVVVLGDRAGLTLDCTCGETRDSADLKLPGAQEDLVRALRETGKPLAAVLVTGRPYALAGVAECANAILQAWLPGEEGGAAIADILFGDANPGGKLPVTFPRSAGQLPVYYNAKPAGTSSHWYGDYVSEKVTPLYPFGHGLSYTKFEYSDLEIGPKRATGGERVEISLNVKNIGVVAGDEVVQLYIRDEYASTTRPIKELKGYRRLAMDPGETCRITFHLAVDQLAFYDNELNLVLERGKIDVMLGSSSQDIRLCGEIEVCGEKKMKVKDRVFVCPVSVA
jgi:beta-glucosidase